MVIQRQHKAAAAAAAAAGDFGGGGTAIVEDTAGCDGLQPRGTDAPVGTVPASRALVNGAAPIKGAPAERALISGVPLTGTSNPRGVRPPAPAVAAAKNQVPVREGAAGRPSVPVTAEGVSSAASRSGVGPAAGLGAGAWGVPSNVRSWSSKRLGDIGSFVDGLLASGSPKGEYSSLSM